MIWNSVLIICWLNDVGSCHLTLQSYVIREMGYGDKVLLQKTCVQSNWGSAFMYKRCFVATSCSVNVSSLFLPRPLKRHGLCPGYTGLTYPQGPRHPNKIRAFVSLCPNYLCISTWDRSLVFNLESKEALNLEGGSREGDLWLDLWLHLYPPSQQK